MTREDLEQLARRILGPRFSSILSEDPQFIERVIKPLLTRHGIRPGEAVDERTARWRNLVKEARKKAYYELRQFRRAGKEVPLEERSPGDIEAITGIICREMEETGLQTIVDLGCGLFPQTLAQWPCKPSYYIAIDNDEDVIRKLTMDTELHEQTRLKPIKASLEDPRLPNIIEETGYPLPGLGLALRTLRVLSRTRKIDLLTWLGRLPLRVLVASEPTQSLVGNRDIRLREKRFLTRLARRAEDLGLVSSWRLFETGSDVIIVMRF